MLKYILVSFLLLAALVGVIVIINWVIEKIKEVSWFSDKDIEKLEGQIKYLNDRFLYLDLEKGYEEVRLVKWKYKVEDAVGLKEEIDKLKKDGFTKNLDIVSFKSTAWVKGMREKYRIS